MRGQWLGRFHATGWTGAATVEVDDLGNVYGGRVYLFSDDASMPSAIAYFEAPIMQMGVGPSEGRLQGSISQTYA